MFEVLLFFCDTSSSLICFHHVVQRNCGGLSDGGVVLFCEFLEQVFTLGGNVLSECIRNKCLHFSYAYELKIFAGSFLLNVTLHSQ